MSNGLLRSRDLIILIIILLAPIKVLTAEIEVAPLINLDDIAPSYDEFDENFESKDLIDTTNRSTSKELDTSKKATIGILNKITAKVSTVEIALGQEKSIYDLLISNKACHISLPEEKPLVAVYLLIKDLKSNVNFSGWMIKDLPSVSSLEHPLYDVWVKNCN
jgi:hypothetical protein